MLQVLTAQRLLPGEVVYWNKAKGWVSRLADATSMSEDEAKAAAERAQDDVAKQIIVAPYQFEVREESGAIIPVKAREMMRARGPSVRTDLGKQAG